jgi:nucleotide-binding universal stress UspA family protein
LAWRISANGFVTAPTWKCCVGSPRKSAINRDERGFDLLVAGFMGHPQLHERIIGGTTDRLVRLAPCSVLVVK